MSMPTSSYSFPSTSYDNLDFTNVGVVETDVGSTVLQFTTNYPGSFFGGQTFGVSPTYNGISWESFTSGVIGNATGAAVSQTLVFNYDVAATAGSQIVGLDGLTVTNILRGLGSLNALEQIFDSHGNLLATMPWTAAQGGNAQWLSSGYSDLHIQLTITSAIGASSASTQSSAVIFSTIKQGFETVGLTLDKQISLDGTNWLDVGNGNLSDYPSVSSGSAVYERVLVVNSGSIAITNAHVGDSGGNGPSGFTVGGNNTFSIAAGQTITSDIATISAVTGDQLDTATVTGLASDSVGHNATVTASDQAHYYGTTPSGNNGQPYGIALDKQISLDGSTWVDVGNANLADNPSVLTGATIYERVIVTNTGTEAITGAQVIDAGGNGPAGFTVGGSGTFDLAGGGTIASDIATIAAASGYQLDTATVTGSAIDNTGSTAPVTDTDQANYTGLTYSVALDKQISTDGSTWVDVGAGNLAQNPAVLAGSTVFERVIVSNTGSVDITGAQIADAGGNGPAGFTVGGSGTFDLAAGGSIVSDVATLTAASGTQLDTATVSGGVSDNYGNTGTVGASDQANYTGLTYSVALDKQISTDGSTWVDVGAGNLAQNPAVLAGSTVFERVIVSNTGSVDITGAQIADAGGNGPAGFTVGGSGTFDLAAGGSIVSDVATLTAASGTQLDTATVSGGVSDNYGNTGTVGASDQANYTGLTYSVALDKQISTDGSTWVDVGAGNLAQNPAVLAGSTVFERVIVSNTGSVDITGAQIADAGGNGPAGFTVGGSGTFDLAAGGSIVSDVATLTAASGTQLDTATVSGGVSDSYGNTGTVGASDQANYTGLTYSVALDKQISTDGSTWVDVGAGNLAQNPSVLAGSTVFERVIVSNTGSVDITGAQIADAGGNGPAGFTVGGSGTFDLAAGGSIVSDVATLTAASGTQLDTATVSGGVSDSYGNTGTVGASDQANYTGLTYSVALDKQISTDGSTWVDVGAGNLAQNPSVLAGSTVFERVIVSNTGSVDITGAQIADAGGNGPAGFTVGGSGTFDLAAGGSIVSDVATMTAASGTQLDTATVSGGVSDSYGNTGTVGASDQANYTGLTYSVALDKQISTDGSTWVDVGAGNLAQNPAVLAGSTVFERVIVSNTGSVDITGAQIADAGGNGPAGFTVGGSGTFDLAAGGSIVSDVATLTAASGTQLDTATVSGGVSDSYGNTGTVGASDQANYTGLTYSVALDKQISTDGSTWVDVGAGNLAQNPAVLAGSTVFERVIVSNTGSVDITGAQIADAGGNGPAGFTVGGSGTFDLAAGGSIVSDVATLTAASGTQLDTATVSGGVSDNYGNTGTVGASDQANYTGLTYSVALDKQISTDGSTWVDVGSGNLAQNPSVLAGSTVFERVIVSNTGSVDITGAQIADAGGNGPAGFTVGGSGTFDLAAGGSIVSDVATITAASGYQLDTATITGTASDSFGHAATVTASDQANYTGFAAPGIAVVKTASVSTAAPGTPVTYTYSVTNTGGLPLSNVVLTDDNATAGYSGDDFHPTYVSGDTNHNGLLDTSEVWSYTATTTPPVVSYAASGTGRDGAESASARIIMQNGTMVVELSSNQANPTSAGQEVSGIVITFAGNPGAASLVNETGTLIDIANGGSVTPYSGSITHWGVAESGSTVTLATAGTGAMGGKPIDLIIGDGPYSNANPSITGRNPQIQGTGTFAVALPGITSSTQIQSISFEFGTGPDNLLCGTPSNIVDTNTVVATGVANGTTVSATDTASVTVGGSTGPSIAIDKQISTDGSTWLDVGNGNLADDPSVAAGTKLFERVIVSNTGGVAISGAHVTDIGGNGPAGFTVNGGSSFDLAVGGTITSDVATITAAAGYQLDTATVSGTASTGQGHHTTVTATDQANYTGETGGGSSGITVVKLPGKVVAGACDQVTYTYDVVNTGSTTLTDVQIADNIGTASNPDFVTPAAILQHGFNVGDTNHNGLLDAGETWQYTRTIPVSGDNSQHGGTGSSDGSGGSGGGSDCGTGDSSGGKSGSDHSGHGSGHGGSGSSSGGNAGSGANCDTGSGSDSKSGSDNSGHGSGDGGSGSGSAWGGAGWGGSGSGANCDTGSNSGHNSGSDNSGSTWLPARRRRVR